MLKNYIKTAFRNIIRNKLYSIINIAGLAIGITVCIFILLYIKFELSYDRFRSNANDIYRVNVIMNSPRGSNNSPISMPTIAPALENDFPEVIESVRLSTHQGGNIKNSKNIDYNISYFHADSGFFNIFSDKLD